MVNMEHFYLKRNEDESGVSGTGVVARGVILPSGHCVVEWLTFTSSIAIYKNVNDLKEIHGHGGKTEIVMGDPSQTKKKRKKKNEDSGTSS
jgi:hypothetical protein